MNWANLFFSPEGRIGRGQFWIAFLILFIAHTFVHFVPVVGSAFAAYVHVCVYSKRLHDMGRSGWWQIIPAAIIAVLAAAALLMGGYGLVMAVLSGKIGAAMGFVVAFGGFLILAALAFFVHLIFTLWVGLTAGEPGDNPYGPPPAPVSAGVGV